MKETHTAATMCLNQRQQTHDHMNVPIANMRSIKYDVITYIIINALFMKHVLMLASPQKF